MPGITGIISKKPLHICKENLVRMIDCMMHEPFYNSGIYVNDHLGVYVGWICHKGSFSDCMPVLNERRDLVLLFCGENFSDPEVTNRLKSNGHNFDNANASYIIHLYEEEGDEFLQRLNGWFSGLIVDLRESKAILFNDRYGMQRIYYHEGKDEVLFSSEAKALMRVRHDLRTFDLAGLGEFFSLGCTIKNKSLFRNISLIPGGSAWTFRRGKSVTKDSYFKPIAWENQPELEKEEFCERLRKTFLSILPRYFCSREPIAMSLTGGLDTRMILACKKTEAGSLPCYTFGGMHGDTLDLRVARKVANACGQPHYALRLHDDFFVDFPDIAKKTVYISDGYLDVCGAHDLYLNRQARNIALIRMTGKFGSEVLRGISTFKSVPLDERLFSPDFKMFIRQAEETLADISRGNRLSFALFKDAPWHEYGRIALEQSQVTYRTPYMDNEFVRIMYQAPKDARANLEFSLKLIKDCASVLYSIKTDMGYGGVESLFSKFAQQLNVLLFKVEWYYNEGMPHWLSALNRILRPMPERLILGRHKYLHYRMWFREQLSGYLKEVLEDKRTTSRPYLLGTFLSKMVKDHVRGVRNYTNEINKIITAELIQRLLIE